MNHSFNSHRIRCISIIGGFLDGTKFELADGLNCFIGARGAGKTTMLEFVRYALDATPSREEQPIERRRIESLVEKNLAGGRVEVTIETKDGMQYIVSRSSGDEPATLASVEEKLARLGAYTGLIGFFSAQGPLAGRFKMRPCFYPSSQGDPAYVSLSVPETCLDLGRTDRLGRTIQCSLPRSSAS